MARLETQINQIYFLPGKSGQVSLILTDEVLSNNSHLFIVGELVNIQKKTELNELKKISEIILNTFREHKKLTGETLFEKSLAQINQSLADLAHSGRKSWLGKFSCIVTLKTSDTIYLANSGQTTALLYRGQQVMEVLDPEKRGQHPLKTFLQFSTGKIKVDDCLLLTTSNLFNYVALQNLNHIMQSSEIAEAVEKTANILRETATDKEGFASFFVTMVKPQPVAEIESVAPTAFTPLVEPEPLPEPVVGSDDFLPAEEDLAETAEPGEPPLREEIYAPLPQELKSKSRAAILGSAPTKIFARLPSFRVPQFSWRPAAPKFFQALSPWAKFFFVSFLIFVILFVSNVVAYTIRKHKKQNVDQAAEIINQLTRDMNDTESALIYRNQDQALLRLTSAQNDLEQLKTLDEKQYSVFAPQLAELASRVNHVTVANNPTVLVTLKHAATDLVRAGNGFLILDRQTGTITTYNTTASDKSGKELFLLNKVGSLKGLVHIPNTGHVAVTTSEMYLVNTSQNQFDLLHIFPNRNFDRIKFISPDKIYSLDRTENQVFRIQFAKTNQSDPVSLLKGGNNLSDAVDIGVDNDVYVLSATDLKKYTNGNLNTGFKLVEPTDEITAGTRLFVANNLYILEAAKKRLLVYNKQGALVNQIQFPTATDMQDLYVDEVGRNIYILDSNKIYSITF